VPVFPRASETFIVNKFLGLLARGWDAHVVCDRRDDGAWSLFPDLSRDPSLRRRVHTAWPVRPWWKVLLAGPIALIGCLAASPARTIGYLATAWRASGWGTLRSFYLDAPLIALGPDVIHFEFGALAVGRMALGERLGCPVVVSFRGYDLNYVGLDQPDH
jgi:colanic acid/amylovoran biosynthesis glycosyltransferase